jgi:hypothetical protein
MAVRARQRAEAALSALLLALAAGCASGPPPPAWQADARAAMDAAIAAHLAGDGRAEAGAFERARGAIARTGRADLLARAELMRCAAQTASLAFGPCAGFEALRNEAAAAELAYAEHLSARALPNEQRALLPEAQRGTAAALAGGAVTRDALAAIEDPWSRLIAIAVLFQAGRADPAMIALAVDTASAQGWRRPLLAWLKVQLRRAEQGGDAAQAERLRRRIGLVEEAR